MAKFIFDTANSQLDNSTLDLSTGTYDAYIVSSMPSTSNNTVADVSVIGNALELTGLSNNSSRWTFNNSQFPLYNWTTAPAGVVIAKRGNVGNPATTDQLICYSDAANSLGDVISLGNGNYSIALNFGADGAIKYSSFYQYFSGAYTTGLLPQGLIYLDGTNNNTVAFNSSNLGWIGSTNITIANAFDRDPNTTFATHVATLGAANALRFIFYHPDYRLRLNVLSLLEGTGVSPFYLTSGNLTISIGGSNNPNADPITNPSALTDNILWDTLYQVTGPNSGNGYTAPTTNTTTHRFTVGSSVFYKFHRVTLQRQNNSSGNTLLNQMEFMGSAILSPSLNLA